MSAENQKVKKPVLPRGRIYWSAILTLVIGSLVAVFLTLTPPQNEASGLIVINSTATAKASTETHTTRPTSTPMTTPTPISTPISTPTPAPTPNITPTPTPIPTIEHTVLDGETISGIATRYGLTTQQIMKMNPQLDPNLIFAGEVILIPTNAE